MNSAPPFPEVALFDTNLARLIFAPPERDIEIAPPSVTASFESNMSLTMSTTASTTDSAPPVTALFTM